MAMTKPGGPLAGIRVLDLTSVLLGPYATQLLAEMGAEVIKVEAPEGDVVRQIGPQRHPGMGCMFLTINRGKRGVALDLKQPAALQALLRLITSCDVLAYNIRPHSMERLGLGWEAVQKINPRIVYAGLYGFGQDGPYAAKPAFDDLMQGLSGLAALNARTGDGTPRYAPLAMMDRVVGLHGLSAILAALVARGSTGLGQRVDVPMFETMLTFTMGDHLSGLVFDPPLDAGGYGRLLSPDRRPYRTKDGFLCAMIYTDKQWRAFFKAIGERDLVAEDPRFASHAKRIQNIDAVLGWLSGVLATRTTAEWITLLDAVDVPVAPVHDLSSIFQDPHIQATGFFAEEDHPSEGRLRRMASPMRFEGGEVPRRPAPRFGEHTLEVLREAGLEEAEIAALVASGAALTPKD